MRQIEKERKKIESKAKSENSCERAENFSPRHVVQKADRFYKIEEQNCAIKKAGTM